MAALASHRPTLREIHESIEVPGHRVELIGGRIIVSPVPQIRHGEIVFGWATNYKSVLCEGMEPSAANHARHVCH